MTCLFFHSTEITARKVRFKSKLVINDVTVFFLNCDKAGHFTIHSHIPTSFAKGLINLYVEHRMYLHGHEHQTR